MTLNVLLARAVLLSLVCAVAPATLAAQQSEAERRRAEYLVEIPQLLELAKVGRRASAPSISTGTPIGYGASYGDLFIGVGYQAQARNTEVDDGGVSIGGGLGNPSRWIGFEAVLTSLSTVRRAPGKNMSLSVKMHRRVGAAGGIALGVENIVHSPDTDGGKSLYLAASNFVQLNDDESRPFASIAYSLGVGNGRFRPLGDIVDRRQSVNAFGSVSVRALPRLSVIADWGGQDLMLGMSVVPFKRFGVVITPALADVLSSANDRSRLIIGVGYGISFLKK